MARVLIVEDDDVLRRSLRNVLEARALEVLEALTVEEALEKADRPGVSAVISDYLLEGSRSGLTLLAVLRRRRPGLPVILMSGYGADWLPSAACRLGARAYLSKPFHLQSFLDALDLALAEPPAIEGPRSPKAAEAPGA